MLQYTANILEYAAAYREGSIKDLIHTKEAVLSFLAPFHWFQSDYNIVQGKIHIFLNIQQ